MDFRPPLAPTRIILDDNGDPFSGTDPDSTTLTTSSSSPEATFTSLTRPKNDPSSYFQQSTSSILHSVILFTFLSSLACLILFSWVRTRRGSIYGSRQFFVREEHRAETWSKSFWGWIRPLLVLVERPPPPPSSGVAVQLEEGAMDEKAEGRARGLGSRIRTVTMLGGSYHTGVNPLVTQTAGPSTVVAGVGSVVVEGAGGGADGMMVVHQDSLLDANGQVKESDPEKQVLQTEAVLSSSDGSSPWRRLVRRWSPSGKGTSMTATSGGGGQSQPSTVPGTTTANPSASTFSASSSSSQQQQQQARSLAEAAARTARQALISKIGLDHYLLIRFLKMLLTLSVVMAVLAVVVLVPVYSVGQSGEDPSSRGLALLGLQGQKKISPVQRVEMLQIGNVTDQERLWATVLITTLITVLVMIWTWSELMTFLQLRQDFLSRSATKYSSRVVLLQNIPPELRSVSALKELFASAAGGGVEHVYLCRDVAALEKAVKQRQLVLDRLEQAEVRYMDAIARASAVVASSTLSMRSRSWIGKTVDRIKACFGYGPKVSNGACAGGVIGGIEDEYVGPLRMYQLEDVPKLSLTDLSSPGAIASSNYRSPVATGSAGASDGSERQSSATSAASLTALKWYQKPRRPRHYTGIPLLSQRQDSIRYYRSELCRLNKKITQMYDAQAKAMAADNQRESSTDKPLQNLGPAYQSQGLDSVVSVQPSPEPKAEGSSPASNLSPVNVLPCAFLLMKTRAGAKMVAHPSSATSDCLVSGAAPKGLLLLAADKIDPESRILGIPPRDIEWRILGQSKTKSAILVSRLIILGIGSLMLVGCGLLVSAITSMSVYKGWERVSAEEATMHVASVVSSRQGILAPILLLLLMLAGAWILNEMCHFWGRVSKMQTELLIQRNYFIFLMINLALIHPILTLSFSWQESITNGSGDSLSTFLIHSIPSYCSFAFAYVLMAGLALPFMHLLQLPRLWATLPAITLWSALGPLSWRKSTQSQPKGAQHGHRRSSLPRNSESHGTTSTTSTSSFSSTSTSPSDLGFESNFTPAPTQTPRQAFLLRQPPFFNLQNLYPHLIFLFTLSLSLLPLAPILFCLWILVALGMNICYRYLVLQVVTTKSQSGGLHYLQAIKLILFPTLAFPSLVLAVYLVICEAWVQAGFAAVVGVAVLMMRVLIGVQFCKREDVMLQKVEEYHQQPGVLLLHSKQSAAVAAAAGAGGYRTGTTRTEGYTTTISNALSSTVAGTATADTSVVDLGILNPQPRDILAGQEFESEGEAHGETTKGSVDPAEGSMSPTRRRMRRMMKRPTTIIGQVRTSMLSTRSSNSNSGDQASRPKSVPVFDLGRYEKEILGIVKDRENLREVVIDEEGMQSLEHEKVVDGLGVNDGFHSRNSSLARAHTTANHHGTSLQDELSNSPEWLMSDIFGDYSTRRAMVTTSVLSKAEEEEEEKEAKYREIVMALRRASSVASRKNLPPAAIAGGHQLQQQRRVRVAGAFTSSSLEAVKESRASGRFASSSSPSPRAKNIATSHHGSRAHARQSLPSLLNRPPNINPYHHQRSIVDALSNVSASSCLSGGGTRGAPSLPMLLIHRESIVAAKEASRIQNLYLNPVLAEAKARVIVWLPSQTEQSFMGTTGGRAEYAKGWMAYCRYHSRLERKAAAALAAARGEVEEENVGTETEEGSDLVDLTAMLANSELTAGHGQSAGGAGRGHGGSGGMDLRGKGCTCHVYQEVMKAVADSVALADQEIRDLRIVGLTVWLDSRHVIWGQENEEDGRLGDRVMISTGPPTTTTLVSGGSASLSQGYLATFGGNRRGGGASSGVGIPGGEDGIPQRQVGDGLLSWLEEEDPSSGGEGGDVYHESDMSLGQGAVGIIGGSMGVIMKRPLGYYGRLVGDGEEDDISRRLIS